MIRKPTFREQVLRTREDVIVESVNRLLAEKGFDFMTVDAVAAEAGIAKASLYKHFISKEELAGAAMVRTLDRALEAVAAARDTAARPVERLKTVTRWAMQQQLAGQMPALPAQNSTLRAALAANRQYLDRLIELSEALGEWIRAAQKSGHLNRKLPAEIVLYTLFARACDPVLGVLKAGGAYTDEQIVELLMSTCFEGLSGAGKRAG